METSEVIGLIGTGLNAGLLAAIGRDSTWNVAEDWGLGTEWKAERVPVGIKFRRLSKGLVTEEVVIARGAPHERITQEKLLSLSQVPTCLVFVERAHAPRNRLAPHFLNPGIGSDS